MDGVAQESTLHEHLQEIKHRLLSSVGVFIIAAGAGYAVRNPLIAWLKYPLQQHLYYTSPMGSFNFIMKLCMLVGLLASLPVILYHLLRYVEPAFERRFSKKLMASLMVSSFTLAVLGVAFAYYISLPAALHFFNLVGAKQITPLISVDSYFSFVFMYLATFAVVFQLPLSLLFIDHITPINPGGLGKWRKLVYVGAFAVALVTPSAPDPLSQVILALPIILLYEVSLVLIRIRHWRRGRRREGMVAQVVANLEGPSAALEPVAAPLQSLEPQPLARTGVMRDLRPPQVLGNAGILDLRQVAG